MGTQKYASIAKKLQTACNKFFGVKLLINSKQWYSEDQNRAITQYSILQVIKSEETQKNTTIELFKTSSQIQMVLFLRDYWYKLNGWEVPTDNKTWEEVKAKYESKNGSAAHGNK